MSRVRANSITNKNADGAPSFTHGAVVTGVATATGFKATGIVTAASFQGDGSALTGIDATALKDSGGSVKVQANSSGAVVTGMLTATGVLTYEDVTNVDSVGVITARNGIRVGAGKSIGSDSGTVTYYGTGTNLTALNAGNLGSGTVPTARLGSGTANTGSFLRGDNSWQPVTSKILQVKFKESGSSRFNATSGSWTKMDGSSGGLQESITPSAVGNTIVVQMYTSMQAGNGEYGGVTISIHDGTNYISMMGESGSSSYTAPASVFASNSNFNEHVRNATGGSMWWPVYLHGRHLTTNTSSHTINLYARMGNGDFYWGDNQAANSMIIWEIEGDIGN